MKRNFLARTSDLDHLHNLIAGSTKKQKTENATRECTIYIGDENDRELPFGSLYAVRANIRGISEAEEDEQVCAHVVGIMICIVPEWKQPLLDLIKDRGFHVDIVPPRPTCLDLRNLSMYDYPSCLTIFGFCLLLLFKNCNQANYNSYANARLSALRAVNGAPPDVMITNPFSLKKAQAVRAILGAIHALKKLVIELIINRIHGTETCRPIFPYLATILEYNEMSAFRLSYETLVITESPILKDSRVSGEVSNLFEAVGLINKSKHPKYFRYLAPKEQVSKIDRARFPTLAAVAQKIKAELMGDESVLQIVSTKGVRDDLVADLFKIHKRAMGTHTPPILRRILDRMFASPVPVVRF
ncbi:hypothetical protein POM88_014477 [Heracleum sosnowskyi]|uniref:Uncharacterized protein n=1 Tax=Heracleum sosnowskyi TaxID=360622 RepID=A0AAD8J160_9APIA|nr:hypothetical protein POM88_014477 [Heracleum sosnowskyi]